MNLVSPDHVVESFHPFPLPPLAETEYKCELKCLLCLTCSVREGDSFVLSSLSFFPSSFPPPFIPTEGVLPGFA